MMSWLPLVSRLLDIYSWIIIIRCILSFFPYSRNVLVQFVYALTEPVMAPFRKLLPTGGGIDFSPILVFFLISLLQRVLYGLAW